MDTHMAMQESGWLIQQTTGAIFTYDETLAKRADMKPYYHHPVQQMQRVEAQVYGIPSIRRIDGPAPQPMVAGMTQAQALEAARIANLTIGPLPEVLENFPEPSEDADSTPFPIDTSPFTSINAPSARVASMNDPVAGSPAHVDAQRKARKAGRPAPATRELHSTDTFDPNAF
jgi:hypothetical protein